MKQRKKQPVQTRQALLAAAGAEFSQRGYAATGLGAIVERSQLTKGALFHHFANKQALAIAWVAEVLGAAVRELWVDPLETTATLEGLRAHCRTRCLELNAGDTTAALVTITAETAALEPALAEALEHVWSQWRQAIADCIERSKVAGAIHRSIQASVEAAFIVAAFAGFSVTTSTSRDDAARRTCASALEGYLETLRAQ